MAFAVSKYSRALEVDRSMFAGLLFKPGTSSASFDQLKDELANLPGKVGAPSKRRAARISAGSPRTAV